MKETFICCEMPGCGARVPEADDMKGWRKLWMTDVGEDIIPEHLEPRYDLCPACVERVRRIFDPGMILVLRPKRSGEPAAPPE